MIKKVVIVPGYDILGIGIEAFHVKLMNFLKNKGYEVYIYEDYKKSMTLPQALNSLRNFLVANNINSANYISFSFGGYFLLKFIEKYSGFFTFENVVLVAPMLGGSRLGKIMAITGAEKVSKNSMIYKAVYDNITNIDIPKKVKIGVLQGTKRTNKIFPLSYAAQAIFLGKENDGFLAEDETFLENCKRNSNCRHKRLEFDHYGATSNNLVMKEIVSFFETGKFS